jgi:hypothetical protein
VLTAAQVVSQLVRLIEETCLYTDCSGASANRVLCGRVLSVFRIALYLDHGFY